MLEKLLVGFASPKIQVANLEVAPEMACAISIGLVVTSWTPLAISQPEQGIVSAEILRICVEKGLRDGPQRPDRLGVVVNIDGEPVGLVVLFHELEDVIINVAVES